MPTPTQYLDGTFTAATQVGPYRVTKLSDGTGAIEVRAEFWQLQANYADQALNTAGPTINGKATYLIGEEGMREVACGVVSWERVWASIPGTRTETMQQTRPCIGIQRTFLNGQQTDIQLFSVSISTWVNVTYTYALGNAGLAVPADGPAGTVIHSSGGGTTITQLLAFNGFDTGAGTQSSPGQGTFGHQFVQSWTNRRWKGDIWENAIFVN